jgi:rhodanese-related sulfurtransferase
VDVRSTGERTISVIPGSVHIPLADLASRLDELPRNRPVYVHCKSGSRSLQAQKTLLAAGFSQVFNVTGGINAWVDKIDPSLAKY